MNKTIFFRYQLSSLLFLCFVLIVGCKNSNSIGDGANHISQDLIQYKESQETISQELLSLETEYSEMLSPISSLKTTRPDIYWFIVSWLKTAYKTPNWKGYYSDEWMASTKKRGIDCSGFSRVMLDQIFDKKVAGGSRRILRRYCTPVVMKALVMGDLVFFRAPYSKNDRIVHVGVYLQDTYFVHATSTRSAAIGLGLSVNSLEEENWAKEFVTGGKIKD